MPLRTRLNHGDQVEIITSKSAGPSPAWERFVVTGKARSRIRRFLRTRQRNDFIAHGRELLQRAGQKERLALGEKRLEAVLETLHQKTVDDLLAAIGEGALNARVVIEALKREQQPAAAPARDDDKVVPLRRMRPVPPTDGRQGLISGLLPGMAISFAGCCHPIPGDAIVGVVRTGRGVLIHRSDCRILTRKPEDADRWLDLGWNADAADAKAIARLHIMTTNQPGSLGSLSTVVGKQGGNITDVRFGARTPDLYEIILDIEVEDREHLDRIVATLRATPVVTHVERTQG